MFTWPINRMSARRQPTLPTGKLPVLRQWKLDLMVAPGFMNKDNVWIPAHDKTMTWPDQVQLSIALDENVVGQHQVGTEQHTLTHWLPDSDTFFDHELRLHIFGLQNNSIIDHSHPMLLINVSIENLVIDGIIEQMAYYHTWDSKEVKKGTQYLGQDGVLTVRICCPIYVWLMDQIGQIAPYKHNKLFQNI